MIAELGHLALILSLGVAVFQMIVPMVGASKVWFGWMEAGRSAAVAQFLLLCFAFGALTYSFVVSDFSVSLVYANSHSAKPMLYKVTGVWGNHEGSMLLWALILSLFGAAAAVLSGHLPDTLRARVLSVQAAVGVAFLAFIIFTSNPFWRFDLAPFDGRDLNPLLQDPGLAFHPPLLYLGYVGLSMTYSFAIAALLEGRVDAAWARWVRPWTLAAWVFLTLGIALGSWWAYYELGWGGFWFWDPVENASFMPWLLSVALLHSAIVVEKREVLKSWTILLAIMAFGFSLIGTFIVRSGVLTSVHSFASDSTRGLYILWILAFFVGGGLTLYAGRAAQMSAKSIFAPISREGALLINNVLLAVATLVVFIGTVWPLIAELAAGRVLSVGTPFFEKAFTPFMIALAVLLPVGTLLPWKRGQLGRVLPRLVSVLAVVAAVMLLVWSVTTGRSALAIIGTGLGVWVIAGSAADLKLRIGKSGFSRLLRLPRADWGRFAAHSGLGVTFIGISLMMAWEVEDIRVARIGESFTVGTHQHVTDASPAYLRFLAPSAYDFTLDKVEDLRGPNYLATRGTITATSNGKSIGTLYPEKRLYPVQGMPTTEAAIVNGIWRDLYVVIGDQQSNGGWTVRTYIKPFANWIWAGAIFMALGGLISLTDRRWRIAAPDRRKPVAASKAVAAE